jgi:hypothetical protein
LRRDRLLKAFARGIGLRPQVESTGTQPVTIVVDLIGSYDAY